MVKKFLAVFKFRTGNQMAISAESIISTKGKNSPFFQLFIDGEPVATLEKGSLNFDQNNNYKVYNASPLPKLYEYMPDDWDKEESSIKIIDEIFIRTQKG